MTMNDETRTSAAPPIVIDIGKAIQQMEENPELAQKLNELAFGKFAADQLTARDELIEKLVEVLNSFPGFTDNAIVGDPWLEHRNAVLSLARGH